MSEASGKWDIRYVEGRRIKPGSADARRTLHIAYLVSILHQNPKAFEELVGMIREAIERAKRGETGRDILLGKEVGA